jgi:hypothetical protein
MRPRETEPDSVRRPDRCAAGLRPAARAAILCIAGAVLLAAAGGCSRLSTLEGRVDGIGDPEARHLIYDALWAGGSKYAWTKHETVRAEVAWTEHTPQGDFSTNEVWLVGLWDGRIRIEIDAPLDTSGWSPSAPPPSSDIRQHEVTVFDGKTWRTFVDGREARNIDAAPKSAMWANDSPDVLVFQDPQAKARGRLAARLARELLLMPLALAGPGLRIKYDGTRVGPGEAHEWDRLGVTYAVDDAVLKAPTVLKAGHMQAFETGDPVKDSTDLLAVNLLRDTRQVDYCFIRWHNYPFSGRVLRVDMKLWQPTEGLFISRLWRIRNFVPEWYDEMGVELYTVEIKSLAFDVPINATTFQKP